MTAPDVHRCAVSQNPSLSAPPPPAPPTPHHRWHRHQHHKHPAPSTTTRRQGCVRAVVTTRFVLHTACAAVRPSLLSFMRRRDHGLSRMDGCLVASQSASQRPTPDHERSGHEKEATHAKRTYRPRPFCEAIITKTLRTNSLCSCSCVLRRRRVQLRSVFEGEKKK